MNNITFPQYENCTLCPRNCGIKRNQGQKGFCKETNELKIAWAGLHFGEEPPIAHKNGSGTIFITGCNLHCAFCQNYQISQNSMGAVVSSDDFSAICLKLQDIGAENINIVSGSHAISSIAQYIKTAKMNGLTIPVCWNCSAYESVEALELLDGIVDIWLPDLKTLNPIISDALFDAKDYPGVAKKAIRWMIDHSTSRFDGDKILGGVIVRHLALPGRMNDTELVLDWFSKHGKHAYLSLMSQYTPVPFTGDDLKKREKALSAFSNRFINESEFKVLQTMLDDFGIENGFYQELSQDTEWLPDFAKTQPFSNKLAKAVWHWQNGFVEE